MNTIFWFCAIVTIANAFTSLGFSIAALRSIGDTYIAALYGISRSMALAIVSVIPVFTGSHSWLLAIATAMTVVQIVDGYVGVKRHDTTKTAGPIFLALLNAVALILLINK